MKRNSQFRRLFRQISGPAPLCIWRPFPPLLRTPDPLSAVTLTPAKTRGLGHHSPTILSNILSVMENEISINEYIFEINITFIPKIYISKSPIFSQ